MLPLWISLAVFGFLMMVVILVLVFKNQKNELLNHQLQSKLDDLSKHVLQNAFEAQEKNQSLFTQLSDKMNVHIEKTFSVMQQSQTQTQNKVDQSAKVFGELKEKLGKIEETNRHIQHMGQNILELQQLFKSPKLRGNLGEHGLENILSHLLPKAHYALQYSFKSGEMVDAVVKLAQGTLISIDSKFPYQNFKKLMESAHEKEDVIQLQRKAFAQDIKKHIDDISKKYIRPEEGTLDFALMYLPAENIYYEVIIKHDDADLSALQDYALKKKVIPVSPNSLYAYLQAIVMGLKGMQIEEKAKDIFMLLEKMKKEVSKTEENFGLLGKHLENASSSYTKVEKNLGKITNQMDSLGLSEGIEIESKVKLISENT